MESVSLLPDLEAQTEEVKLCIFLFPLFGCVCVYVWMLLYILHDANLHELGQTMVREWAVLV